MSSFDVIYKICTKDEWEKASASGIYSGSKDDLRDGFIHFSCLHQLQGTLDKHFKGKKDLLLLEIDIKSLDQSTLKWEKSRNQEKFPHLYGALNLDAVISKVEISNSGKFNVLQKWE